MTASLGCLDAFASILKTACWQGGLVVLAVWLICRVIPAIPARVQCWLWRLALLKFVLALLPAVVDLPWLPASPAATPHGESRCDTAPLGLSTSSAAGGGHEWPDPRLALCALWVAGFLGCAGRIVAAWREAVQLRASGTCCRHSTVIARLNALCGEFHLKTIPECIEVPGGGSPMLVGMVRPAIVIPTETLHRLNAQELTIVLGHELAHLRHGDLLWNLVAALVRALFFFHPLAWLGQRRLSLSQEIAADALAMTRQQVDAAGYGELLLAVVGKLGPARLIPTMSMGTAGHLESLTRRLVAMRFTGRTSRRVQVASVVALGAVMLTGLVPWRLVAAESKEENGNARQFLAAVTITESRKGEAKTVISAPKMLVLGGQKAMATVGDERRRLEVTVGPSPEQKPSEHVVQVQIVQNPEGKNRVVLAAPKITVTDGQTGKVCLAEGGVTLEIEATISPVK